MDSDRIIRWEIKWRAAPNYGWIFEGEDLKELLTGKSGRAIRSSSTRRVVQGRCTGRGKAVSLFVKIYKPPRFPLSLLRSAGMREYRALKEAERRGVETVRAIAIGEARKMGALTESYLLTEELPDCNPLSEISLQSVELQARRRIIRSLAEALRSFHDRGVLHRDLHSGNILIRCSHLDRAEGPVVFIMDLYGARFRRFLNLEDRMKNLVQLDTYYGLVASRSDRWFFLRNYARDLGCDMKELAAAVVEGALRARWRLWQRRRKRYLGDEKYSRALRCGGYRGFISSRRDTNSLRRLLSDPRGAYGRGHSIKSSRTNRVASIRTDGPEHVIIKWHRPPSLWKKAWSFMRSSRGMKAWYGAKGITERMIRGPEAIAFLDGRRFGFVTESFFIADFLEMATVLPHYVRDRKGGMSVRERRVFCSEMGKFLAHLHRRGIYHTDLKGSNIMVDEGAGGKIIFYLLDPEAVRFVMRVSPRMAIKNLSRLDRYMRSYASAVDRLVTLSSYLATLGSPGRLRYFWRAIGSVLD